MGVKSDKFISDLTDLLNSERSKNLSSTNTSYIDALSRCLTMTNTFIDNFILSIKKFLNDNMKISDLKSDSIFEKMYKDISKDFYKNFPDWNIVIDTLIENNYNIFITELRESIIEKDGESVLILNNNNTIKGNGDFKITVNNSKSIETQKIEGKIVFTSSDKLSGLATLSGFPQTYTNKITNKPVFGVDYNYNTSTVLGDSPTNRLTLAYEALTVLQDKIKNDYGFIIQLKIEDISTNESTNESYITNNITTTPVVPLEGEFLFNVLKDDFFIGNDNIGELFIIGKGEIYENLEVSSSDDSLDPEYIEESFQGSEELAIEFEAIQSLQLNSLDSTTPTAESTARVDDLNIDFNSDKYVGGKWKSFNIDKLISLVSKKYQPTNIFKESLKKVLYYIKNDQSIDDVRKAAYLLGTAFAESGYSLQRWESDYACTGAGIKYGPNGPCISALNYYKSTKGGKKNYYDLGTDSRGFPYFGRGLIQLTGKANYKSYGDLLNIDLVKNGDLAIQEQNSYKIAVEYMKGNPKTFKKVLNGDLTAARRSVNGGKKGIDEVNGAYKAWLDAFDKVGL
jgi:hypothetical protein